MKIIAYIVTLIYTGLFSASFITEPFPLPGIFYLLPAIFVLTTLQLFEKGKQIEGAVNGVFTAIFIGIALSGFIL